LGFSYEDLLENQDFGSNRPTESVEALERIAFPCPQEPPPQPERPPSASLPFLSPPWNHATPVPKSPVLDFPPNQRKALTREPDPTQLIRRLALTTTKARASALPQ